jgi:tetratricopeptide (TPR) repeat protein
MRPVIRFLKQDPFLTGVGLLAASQLLWFCAAPQGFKTIWNKNFLVAEIVKEHDFVDQKAKLVAISYYFPTFQYFADIASGKEQPKKALMDGYHFGKPYIFYDYYQKSVDLLPERDEPHFLLGFCDYYLGNPDEAVVQYGKSMEINPYFFWSYYDLGVIYFQQGDFLSSATILNKALSLRKDITLSILYQSPFYRQIWHEMANLPQIFEINLSEGQEDTMLLLAACFVNAGGYDQALQIIQSVGKSNSWHQELWEKLHQKALLRQKSVDDIDRLIQEQIPVRLF